MRRAVVLILLAACGRIDFEPRGDAAIGCDVAAPFGAPVLVAGLDSGASSDITLRLDGQERFGVFWSDRTGDADIFTATRPDLGSAFTATLLPAVNSVGDVDADPTIPADASFIVFASTRAGGPGGFDLYEAEAIAGGYAAPVVLGSVSTPSTEGQPNYSPAESALYFASDRSGTSHIYRARRTGAASYDAPTEVSELTSTAEEFDPVPSADGLVLYFRSSRPGGPGGTDAFVATRATLADPFGNITLVAGVNSTAIDGPSFISRDLCRLYLTSDRTGTPKLYVASR